MDENNTKKKFRIRYVFLGFISVMLIFAISISAYMWKLLNEPIQTIVPIITGGVISEGLLDNLSDVEDDNPIDVDISNDSSAASSVSASNAGKNSYIPRTWGNGRVKLYVDTRFPIFKVTQKDPNIENILVIGVDARSASEKQSRTDSIIVVSVDKTNKAVKLTSFMRDTQVKIPGRTYPCKINAAYVYGGIGLLINTLNSNFDLDIQKFAMVDMLSSENIIDAAGGVVINVKANEVSQINGNMSETNSLFKSFSEPSAPLTKSGEILLNGRQAVAYGRIRHIGSDQGRTLRQRTVLTALIVSFKASPVSRKMKIFEKSLQSFETSMSKNDMFVLAFNVLLGMKNVQQYRVPEDGMYTSNSVNWQLKINFLKQLPALHKFIWGAISENKITIPEELPEPTIPDTISSPEELPEPTITDTISSPEELPEPTITVTISS